MVAAEPGIHQRAGRAGVEADDAPMRAQHGDVGDAAQVQHHMGFAGLAQHHRMQRRHQRCALAAGGDVGAAEVGHGVDTGVGGDHRGVAQLQGERVVPAGAVAQCLAVRTDGFYLRCVGARSRQHGVRGVREAMADGDVQPAEGIQVKVFLALRERQHAGTDVLWPGMGDAMHQ